MDATIYVLNDEGDEVELPAKFEVCSRCRGTGTHTNPNIDGNGITASEMDELGDDFRRDYMNGFYDVTCYECNGARVVAVFDAAKATKEERKFWKRHERALAEADADERSERFLRQAECGYCE